MAPDDGTDDGADARHDAWQPNRRMATTFPACRPPSVISSAIRRAEWGKSGRMPLRAASGGDVCALFDGDRFGEVAGLVDVESFGGGERHGEDLQGDDGEHGFVERTGEGNANDFVGVG